MLEDVSGAELIHVKLPQTPEVPSVVLKNVKDFSVTQSKPLADSQWKAQNRRLCETSPPKPQCWHTPDPSRLKSLRMTPSCGLGDWSYRWGIWPCLRNGAPGLNGASALCSPQCSAQVCLRPLATSRM